MSASATSSSSSSQDESEGAKNGAERDAQLANQKSLQTNGYTNAMYANSTISTLDRSQYQSLPLSGTRRVTVQFGQLKIVVPWKESPHSTVQQLADAALLRYKRAIGIHKSDERVRVIRLECASDGGILDMDDVLEDVFDLNYDQILAITDEANTNNALSHHYAQPLPVSRTDIPGPSGISSPIASAYGSVSVNAIHQQPSTSPYGVGYIRKSISSDDSRHRRPDSIVEIRDLKHEVSPGLKVHSTSTTSHVENKSSLHQKSDMRDQKSALRSSAGSECLARNETPENETPTSPKQSRVTLSPEVEKKLAERENERTSQRKNLYEKNPARLQRGADRKSRINDAFMDARDRLVEKFESELAIDSEKKNRTARSVVRPGTNPDTTVICFNATSAEEPKCMGIEVNAVYDDEAAMSASTSEGNRSSKLSAIQIMKIDSEGRIAKDGRLKIGDNILEIDGRPVYQMSILRARAYISDLAVSTKDVTLTVARPIESFLEEENEKDHKPIKSALQQANTQYIGHTTIVELVKGTNGFGFTVTGRETSKGERLFYIGTVKPNGVALGHLKTGDRLLEINGESTGNLTQAEIVDKLKETMIGGKVKFLVARVAQSVSANGKSEKEKQNATLPNSTPSSDDKENEKSESEKKNEQKEESNGKPDLLSPPLSRETPTTPSPFEIIIPLNDTGSAGLGVSLKARVSVKSDNSRNDCGIFIKNVMHGGAAFKDGRLQINDRIIGIEDIELQSMSNSAASEALTKKLKSIGPNSSHVRLTIIRENDRIRAGPISRDCSRITVDAPSPAPSSRMSSTTAPGSLLHSPHSRTVSSSGADSQHSRQSSTSASHNHVRQESSDRNRDSLISESHGIDDAELPGQVDPFDREAPGRKSLSEKRGIGAASDPQHIKLFQEIKHQRQNSAPPSSTSREKRSKSQPRSLSQRNYRSPAKSGDVPEPPSASTMPRHQPLQTSASEGSGILTRRSLSMESINRPPVSIIKGTGLNSNSSSSKVQFSAGEHPFPPGSPLMRIKSEENRTRDKSRRKSVGNAMKNFFGFGSKSRDASPEKGTHFENISSPDDALKSSENSTSRRGNGPGAAVFVDYGEPYGVIPQYPPHQSQTLASDGVQLVSFTKKRESVSPEMSPICLGNSKFYSSYRDSRPRLQDTNRTRMRNSMIAMPRTVTSNTAPTTVMMNSSTVYQADRRAHRPMSTMDYQHLIRTMPKQDYQRQQHQEGVSQRRVYVEPTIMKNLRTEEDISTSRRREAVTGREAEGVTTTTCSTRGLRIPEEERLVQHQSSSRHMDRPCELQPLRPSNEANRLPVETGTVPDRRTVMEGEPFPAHTVGRRRSMRMLELQKDSMAGLRECSSQGMEEESARQRLLVASKTEALLPRRGKSGGETTSRLIVFPNTRFPIASSSLRVSSSSSRPMASNLAAFLNSSNLRPIQNEPHDRISLRSRKKLHREAVTRSEIYLPLSSSNENVALFNKLLPPSTSSIMATTPTEIPVIRE